MTTYYELVIKGDDRDLIPYLAGYAAAVGVEGVFFAEESGLHVQALRERIKHHGEVQHVVCAASARAKLLAGLERAAPRFHFEVKDERVITSASFAMKVETPSRKVADQVTAALVKPPRGVQVKGFAPRVDVDPSSKGAEIYAPAHDYRFDAGAEIDGDVAGVIALRRALSAIDFVKCDEIALHG